MIMKLTAKRVSHRLPEYRQVKSMMEEAFPRSERFAMWELHLLAFWNRKIDFLAFYDNSTLVGVAYTVYTDKMAIPLYLAVDRKQRSHGYGAAILNDLKERYHGIPLTVESEIAQPDAENFRQRQRRIEFYKRNGFSETGWYLTDDSGKYTLMSTADVFAGADYQDALFSFMHGLYRVQIISEKEMSHR